MARFVPSFWGNNCQEVKFSTCWLLDGFKASEEFTKELKGGINNRTLQEKKTKTVPEVGSYHLGLCCIHYSSAGKHIGCGNCPEPFQ